MSTVIMLPDDIQQFECDICAFPYGAVQHRPVTLPCGHTPCDTCFSQVKDSCAMYGRSFACSTCRAPLPPDFLPKTNFKLLEFIDGRDQMVASFARIQAENEKLRKEAEMRKDIPFTEVCENALGDVESMFINAKDEFDSIDKETKEVANILRALRTTGRAPTDLREKVKKEAEDMTEALDNNFSSLRKVVQAMRTTRTKLESLCNDAVRSELKSLREKAEKEEATKSLSKGKQEEKRVPRLETAFIVGLPRKTTESEVAELLNTLQAEIAQDSCGKQKVTPYKNENGICRGFMVTFINEATAKRVISQLNGTQLLGSNVRLRVDHGLFKERSGDQPATLPASLSGLSLSTPNSRTTSRINSAASPSKDHERKVFVCGLPKEASLDQIVSHFNQQRNIQRDSNGMMEIESYKTKEGDFNGMCVITYESTSAADSIISTLHKSKLPGTPQRLTVSKFTPKS